MADDLLDLHTVGKDGQVVPRSFDLDRARRMAPGSLAGDARADGHDVVPSEMKERAMVLDARHVQQVFDEPLEALTVLQDRLGGFVSHLRAETSTMMSEG